MRGLRSLVSEVAGSDQTQRLAGWLNPVVASPAAPLETFAALDAVGPSLMPRTSRLAGVAMGLSVLAARASAGAAERLTRVAVPADAPIGRQLAARAVVGAAGTALAALPERTASGCGWRRRGRPAGSSRPAPPAGRSTTWAGQDRYPAQRAIRPLAVSTALASGLLGWGTRRLRASEAAVRRWPLPQTTTLPATLATSYAVTAVGTGLTRGFVWSRGALESYFGPGPTERLLARLVNAGIWAAGATAAYNAGVAYVGRANEKVEPGYATPPASPLVSGSAASLLPFADLGQQGRRYVTDVARQPGPLVGAKGLDAGKPLPSPLDASVVPWPCVMSPTRRRRGRATRWVARTCLPWAGSATGWRPRRAAPLGARAGCRWTASS
jgi:Alpha/beta-hydrolase family N-terminus